MKTINQPVYYVPYVRIIADEINLPGFNKIRCGNSYPIANTDLLDYDKNHISILMADDMGCHQIKLSILDVELFVKVLRPKFKLGEIVTKTGTKNLTFRIYEYDLVQGKIWYRDGWSVSTGCESGVFEHNLEYPDASDIDVSGCGYYDTLVSRCKSALYKSVMSQPISYYKS